MIADDKFCLRKAQKVDITYFTSMTLNPENEWTKEADRVSLRFRTDTNADFEHERVFLVSMSRKEAKNLGETLVRYGNTILDHEK